MLVRRTIIALIALAFARLTRAESAEAQTQPQISVRPIYRIVTPDGKLRLAVEPPPDSGQHSSTNAIVFFAVVTVEWPAGLVPLFGVEKNGHFELRRRPLRGQENLSEPLCFAWPNEDESEAAKIAGRWDCVATHADGSKKYPGFELTIDGAALVGRFDQGTDYRFAFIAGGSFSSNRIELNIDYIQDHYTMGGQWRDGKLSGVWEQMDSANRGTWEATRPPPKARLVVPAKKVPLYEWRRAADGEKRYSVAPAEPSWERAARPLCSVWLK